MKRESPHIVRCAEKLNTKYLDYGRLLGKQRIVPMSKDRELTWILRHGAHECGIPIDASGCVLLDDLLSHERFDGMDRDALEQVIVQCCETKPRLSVVTTDRGQAVRANHGHSLSGLIDLERYMEPMTDPTQTLVHATSRRAWRLIETQGLSSMERTHIHFGTTLPTGNGRRAQMAMRVFVNVPLALRDGYTFYRSATGVVLCRGQDGILPAKYLIAKDRKEVPVLPTVASLFNE